MDSLGRIPWLRVSVKEKRAFIFSLPPVALTEFT